jgi:DNA-binding NarL/FixJ family response regulator
MAATGPLLLFSTSPLRREAFRVLLLYHADIPVVGVGELLDAVRTLETASCTAVLVDCTVPEPSCSRPGRRACVSRARASAAGRYCRHRGNLCADAAGAWVSVHS